jgi:hypothetical protein
MKKRSEIDGRKEKTKENPPATHSPFASQRGHLMRASKKRRQNEDGEEIRDRCQEGEDKGKTHLLRTHLVPRKGDKRQEQRKKRRGNEDGKKMMKDQKRRRKNKGKHPPATHLPWPLQERQDKWQRIRMRVCNKNETDKGVRIEEAKW